MIYFRHSFLGKLFVIKLDDTVLQYIACVILLLL